MLAFLRDDPDGKTDQKLFAHFGHISLYEAFNMLCYVYVM